MATTKTSLTKGTWTQIAPGKCIAQAAGGAVIFALGTTAPAENLGLSVTNGEMFCNALDSACWAQAVSADCAVVVADEA